MSYRYDKEKKQKNILYTVGIIFIVIIFFTPTLTYLYDGFEKPLTSLWNASYNVKTAGEDLTTTLFKKHRLLKENEELKEQLHLLNAEVERVPYLESLLASYEAMTENSLGDEIILPAEVLARSPLTTSGTLIINRGERDGVTPGDTVVAYNNILIGYVAEVFDTTSRVTLYTHNTIETQAIFYPEEESITLIGHGGGYKTELPRETEAEVGSIAYSQGEPGRVMGIVQKIVFDPRDPFKQVYLSLPISLNHVQVVGVIKSTQ